MSEKQMENSRKRQSEVTKMVEHYLQNGDKYYDDFLIYKYNDRDQCKEQLAYVWEDYIAHGKSFVGCEAETIRVYKNVYSNCNHAVIQNKRDKAANFFLEFINDPTLKEMLKEYGLTVHGNSVFVNDTKKVARAFLNNLIIPKIEKHLHIKGLKPISTAKINSYSLLDFSKVEIVEDK